MRRRHIARFLTKGDSNITKDQEETLLEESLCDCDSCVSTRLLLESLDVEYIESHDQFGIAGQLGYKNWRIGDAEHSRMGP